MCYESVGTLRCEIHGKESKWVFVPDSDHCVRHKRNEDKTECAAAFVGRGNSAGTVRPLTNGGVEIKVDAACQNACLVAAVRQVRVEVTVEIGKDDPVLKEMKVPAL